MAITFSKAGFTSWTPARGRNRPAEPRVKLNDVADLTEAGTYRISNYGADLVHPFEFEDLPRADYDGGWNWATKTQAVDTMSLVGFFFGVAERMLNTFTFTDEAGVAHTVRFMQADFRPSDPDSRYVNISFELIQEHYV